MRSAGKVRAGWAPSGLSTAAWKSVTSLFNAGLDWLEKRLGHQTHHEHQNDERHEHQHFARAQVFETAVFFVSDRTEEHALVGPEQVDSGENDAQGRNDHQTQRPTTIERGVANRIDRGRRQPFHGGDAAAVGLRREHQARADRGAVDDHRAGAAHAMLAADMRTGEQEIVTQKVAQQQARLHATPIGCAVDGDRNLVPVSVHDAPVRWRSPKRARSGRRRYGADTPCWHECCRQDRWRFAPARRLRRFRAR